MKVGPVVFISFPEQEEKYFTWIWNSPPCQLIQRDDKDILGSFPDLLQRNYAESWEVGTTGRVVLKQIQ